MTTREDIAAILADAQDDKLGRIARLKARRLLDRLEGNLPFIWQPRANVSVTIKGVTVRGTTVSFMVDVTIRGVTKSLTEWVQGIHSPPDWQITDPRLFVDDPSGDVTLTADDGSTRRGRDDFVAAMKQSFVDSVGAKIADLVRATAP